MAKTDIAQLVLRVQERPDGKASVKVRTLLKALGYSRRSPEVIRSIHEQLAAHSVTVELTVSAPATLDEFVVLVLAAPSRIAAEAPMPRADPTADPSPTLQTVEAVRTLGKPHLALPSAVPAVEQGASETLPAQKSGTTEAGSVAKQESIANGVSSQSDFAEAGGASVPEPPRSFAGRLFRVARSFFTKEPPMVLGIAEAESHVAVTTDPSTVAPGASVIRSTLTHAADVTKERLAEGIISASAPYQTDAPELSQVAEQTVRATVFIKGERGSGSGFLLHPDGLVVTACHVLDGPNGIQQKATVRFHDGRESAASIVRAHRSLDFALLWLDNPGKYPVLPIGEPQKLRYAETVLAVGHPGTGIGDMTLTNTVSTGVVANPNYQECGVEWIQTTTDIDPGNSGGPLVNRRGEVIGINCWKFLKVAAAKMALPLDYLEDDVTIAAERGRDGHRTGRTCSICGSFESETDWFCPTCGAAYPTAS